MRNYLVLGDWNAICDRCGFKHKASELRQEWTGLMVCSPCFEVRHPQTLIKVPEEKVTVPWSRPEPTDTFISLPEYLLLETADSYLPADWIMDESGVGLLTET